MKNNMSLIVFLFLFFGSLFSTAYNLPKKCAEVANRHLDNFNYGTTKSPSSCAKTSESKSIDPNPEFNGSESTEVRAGPAIPAYAYPGIGFIQFKPNGKEGRKILTLDYGPDPAGSMLEERIKIEVVYEPGTDCNVVEQIRYFNSSKNPIKITSKMCDELRKQGKLVIKGFQKLDSIEANLCVKFIPNPVVPEERYKQQNNKKDRPYQGVRQ